MINLKNYIVTLAILLFYSQSSSANEVSERLLNYHAQVGTNLRSLAAQIDKFFVNPKNVEEYNRTNLRFYQIFSKVEGQDFNSDFNFKLNVDLPNLKRRFKFSLERRTSKESNAISESKEELVTESDRVNETRGGFSFLNSVAAFDMKLSTGVRIDIPPTPFAEFKLSRDEELWGLLLNIYTNTFWSHRGGLGQSAAIDFSRDLTTYLLLRFVNEGTWLDSTDRILVSHGPSFYYTLSKRRVAAFNARLNYANRPHYRLENYDLSLSYRQVLVDDIFFYELIPGLTFPREINFKRQPSIALKLELVF